MAAFLLILQIPVANCRKVWYNDLNTSYGVNSMDAQHLLAACKDAGIDFFTGVPDSQLKGLCDTLYATLGVQGKHVVAANEGNAIGLCAGHYLATGRPALCYMQNSGLGLSTPLPP